MDNMSEKQTALTALLEKRLELAEKYLELTALQETALNSDDDAGLLSSLNEREKLAGEIDSANKNAEEALSEYSSGKIPKTEEAEILLKRTRELYMECLTLDRKNMKTIKEQMNKASGDSKELQKRREGINKYSQADYIFTPSVLDERQ